MICIYSITCQVDGRRYIGKTINSKSRFANHKSMMKRSSCAKSMNRHLWSAAQEHGVAAFTFEVIEGFTEVDEVHIAMRELHWMGHFRSCDRGYGYNLRADSRTKMVVHEETLCLYRNRVGQLNPNFGRRWTKEQKNHMSEIKKAHALSNPLSQEVRANIGKKVSERFATMTNAQKKQFSENVAKSKLRYRFVQKHRNGLPLRIWGSVAEIIKEHPAWKWQNIYSVCNGYKKTYQGFVWEKVPL